MTTADGGLARWLDYCLLGKSAETVNTRLPAVGSWYGYLTDNDIDVRDRTPSTAASAPGLNTPWLG